MRKTFANHIYSQTKNIEEVRRLVRHQSVADTSTHLNVCIDEATALPVQDHF